MEKFSLDRDWKFYNGDFELPETKTHTECYMAAKAGGAIGAASPDFDKSDWETVNLPHDWAVYNEFEEKWGPSQGYKKRGKAWYSKRFRLDESDRDKQILIEFEGISSYATVYKPTGAELLWQADPAVWKRHAPILFPYTGKLTGGKMLAKGVEYAGGQHGFARDVEHTMTHHADNLLEFELHANAETLPKWPYAFVLRSTFTLEGETVHHTLTVENPVEDKLCFGIGYHPAFALPFDDRHVTEDYEIRFDGVESPLCVSAQPNGLLNGQSYYLARNVEAIQLTDDLFDNDSHAMVNLRSAHVSVIEKDTGRSVICDVSDFPYTLIWSAPKKPLHFICIEPWHSLPGEENGPIDWEQRPCAAILKKGESWSTTLSTTFVR